MASRIGVLTGGGDCPGLNAVIRAVVRRGIDAHDLEIHGFRNGWQGVLRGESSVLDFDATRGILHRGGTILGTSRTDPIAAQGGVEGILATVSERDLAGFVVIGGEGTLSAATRLHDDHGIPIVGVPKTIDNDLGGTDATIGFATALEVATEAIDRLHTTAESHNRVMLLEVMGRHAGWIATYAGIAGGADAILVPERPFNVDRIAEHLKNRHERGRTFSIVVVAEGAMPEEGTIDLPEYARDEFGRPILGGIGEFLAPLIEQRTGFSTRVTTLGHVQRGGTPNVLDRVLGSVLGVAAVDLAAAGRWGRMVGIQGNSVRTVPLADATRELRTVPPAISAVAEVFFG
jgi:ATP-dependent phosphofructokinase / diphosphate-dependent phosphofructokinase